MAERPLILLSNDDGVSAPGISAALDALADLAEIVVAAPDRERSATSHSISLDRPLRADEIRPQVFSIDGTPVDCVYLALLHLVPRKPDLVVSGINNGFNLGSDVFYSGTVAAAVEGALREVPAVAISLERRKPQDFSHAARFLRSLVSGVLAHGRWAIPRGSLLNVNLPQGPVTAYEVTFLGRRVYRDMVDVRQDLRGRSYYWIGGPEEKGADESGSDCSAVQAGRASVTPLGLDLTNRAMIADLASWRLDGFVQTGPDLATTKGP